MKYHFQIQLLSFALLMIPAAIGCHHHQDSDDMIKTILPANVLDYSGIPNTPFDREALAFSDQGAWFAYGLPEPPEYLGGFTGPYLLTQDNGVWCSKMLSQLHLFNPLDERPLCLDNFSYTHNAFLSHLEQVFSNDSLEVLQRLFFSSAHTAVLSTQIRNLSGHQIRIGAYWTGTVFLKGLKFIAGPGRIELHSESSKAVGWIQIPGNALADIQLSDSGYVIQAASMYIEPGENKSLLLAHSFLFPEDDAPGEQQEINSLPDYFTQRLCSRIHEKEAQLEKLCLLTDSGVSNKEIRELLAKAMLTLQNNWRIGEGELRHGGLFPSYHYQWFNGFWAWDSWKHAAALATYAPQLAKEQIMAMYDYQDSSGFIPDCIFRDTSIEAANYRNTKPPLSAWAVWKIFQQDQDTNFIQRMLPKIMKQHLWWYLYRDHDNDGLCEYGSTDGSLVAAKWESGMDNAVRFDYSHILQNSEGAFSLNQESVDLNAYLYAEKNYLANMEVLLHHNVEAARLRGEARVLKMKISAQFYDSVSGWFYDTSLDGKKMIKAMACEGWIPLWAEAATQDQADAVAENMRNPARFNTRVPFQTLAADHPEFEPEGGYWRGPCWLDQAYFGVVGLKKFGYLLAADSAVDKLIHNAEGLCEKGPSIRENYNPMTGNGQDSKNFSWSAAHYILLLSDN